MSQFRAGAGSSSSSIASTPDASTATVADAGDGPWPRRSTATAGAEKRCAQALAYCTAAMGLVIGSVRLRVDSVADKISYAHGGFVLAMGFVFFVSLTRFLQTLLLHTHHGRAFCVEYKLLRSDAKEITNKLVSSIQAALSCTAGFMVCTSSCRRSFLTASHYMSDTYAWFGCAYFVYDMWDMYTVHVQKVSDKVQLTKHQAEDDEATALRGSPPHPEGELYEPVRAAHAARDLGGNDGSTAEYSATERRLALHRLRKVSSRTPGFIRFCLENPVMTIHHVFLQSFGLFVIVYLRGSFGDCVYGFVYLMEFSTPFVSMRGILSTLQLKDSRLYVVNGLVMLGTFFVCRVFMWPYLYWWYGQTVNMNIFEAIYSLPRTCKIGTAVLFFPQIYWFYLMMNGAIQVFCPAPKNQNGRPLLDKPESLAAATLADKTK